MQMRFFARTDPLSCEHTHFEMYFLVILPFDPGEGTLSYIDYIVMSSLKVYEVFLKTFCSELYCRFWPFSAQIRHGFCTLVLNYVSF